MEGDYHLINNDFALEQAIQRLRGEYAEHGRIYMQVERADTRTGQQNKSLHVYCRELATALNDAGWEQRRFFSEVVKPGMDIPWRQPTVKENIWRPVQLAITGQRSSTRPRPDEYLGIYETINRNLGQATGVHVPWPVRERTA